jgi:beta-glucosidase/6-phospho-beta-glucosidase/beta-galactosidase
MKSIFPNFFIGGFECSSHRSRSGKRLDLIAATKHDKFVRQDYLRLKEQGIATAREGIRWHLIESTADCYNFSSVLPTIRAAREVGLKVIWDLFHFGYPDNISNIFSPEFVNRFANLAYAFIQLLATEGDKNPYVAPINEISYFAWAGGEVGLFAPFARGHGEALKQQLVRATIKAIEAIWSANPHARIFHIDPLCNIVADPVRRESGALAEAYHAAQYHAWDMIRGHLQPQLGGKEEYLDIIGINYYPTNQWVYPGGLELVLKNSHPLYRPPWQMICEVYRRYGRPLFIAETGTEDEARAAWLSYICDEVRMALQMGAQIEGICLYPILNHPGWEDDRHCCNGLWDYPDAKGERQIYEPLAVELSHQRLQFESIQCQIIL